MERILDVVLKPTTAVILGCILSFFLVLQVPTSAISGDLDDMTDYYANSAWGSDFVPRYLSLRGNISQFLEKCPTWRCRWRTSERITIIVNYLGYTSLILATRLFLGLFSPDDGTGIVFSVLFASLLLHTLLLGALAVQSIRNRNRIASTVTLGALAFLFLYVTGVPSLLYSLGFPYFSQGISLFHPTIYASRGPLAYAFLFALAGWISGHRKQVAVISPLLPFIHLAQSVFLNTALFFSILLWVALNYKKSERKDFYLLGIVLVSTAMGLAGTLFAYVGESASIGSVAKLGMLVGIAKATITDPRFLVVAALLGTWAWRSSKAADPSLAKTASAAFVLAWVLFGTYYPFSIDAAKRVTAVGQIFPRVNGNSAFIFHALALATCFFYYEASIRSFFARAFFNKPIVRNSSLAAFIVIFGLGFFGVLAPRWKFKAESAVNKVATSTRVLQSYLEQRNLHNEGWRKLDITRVNPWEEIQFHLSMFNYLKGDTESLESKHDAPRTPSQSALTGQLENRI